MIFHDGSKIGLISVFTETASSTASMDKHALNLLDPLLFVIPEMESESRQKWPVLLWVQFISVGVFR